MVMHIDMRPKWVIAEGIRYNEEIAVLLCLRPDISKIKLQYEVTNIAGNLSNYDFHSIMDDLIDKAKRGEKMPWETNSAGTCRHRGEKPAKWARKW